MKELFENRFREKFSERLSGLYLPKITRPTMNQNIIHTIMDAAAETGLLVWKLSIYEVQAMEYRIEVNHDIKIKCVIDQGKEASHG
ncbi:hypothetical protein DN752_17980 [Echinicola strongylocentroti]|uniref:Uncharacterized protein n=1 Tax=Echinicola strongylocentroti TaxID=1795355 RepID=A0A2Z4IMB3_9BACT|nr:hypothetical protein [Echinicola strongylocentroti]AWW31870.1 hypothetical protein DN752_17980 [Echinicola strongylocentroti]